MNRVMIVGNLGQKPDVRQANSGTSVCNFSVATNESVKKGDQWEDHTENCAKYLDKGKKVAVDGKLRTSSYEDKQGNPRKSTEIIADKVEFLTKADKSESTSQDRPASSNDYGNDGIPF